MRGLKLIFTAIGLTVVGYGFSQLIWSGALTSISRSVGLDYRLSKEQLAKALKERFSRTSELASSETLLLDATPLQIKYTIDPELQRTADRLLKTSQASHAALVALDPTTGKVLAMSTHGPLNTKMLTSASFPAASLFKLITAAAALENGKLNYNSKIPVLGSYHTLYKRNLFRAGGIDPLEKPRFGRLIAFDDAFGKSVNSVFGKVGVFGVGSQTLRLMAQEFRFGKIIPFEFNIDPSHVVIPEDEFGLAESSSGFTRLNTISVLHAALLASTIANNGIMMEPGVVERATDVNTAENLYELRPEILAEPISAGTAKQLTKMMEKTITEGTSRGSFRGIRKALSLELGGKTGSLDGASPPGRYDWFIGYAKGIAPNPLQKIAIAVLCVHGPRRGQKASLLARKAIESYYKISSPKVSPITASR